MKRDIQFADDKIKNSFDKLEEENPRLFKFLTRAFEDIQENCFCGIQIPKRLIPSDYLKKFNVKNLWKYNLPDAWRLIYSIQGKNLMVLSIILEWLDHKSYEKRFNY